MLFLSVQIVGKRWQKCLTVSSQQSTELLSSLFSALLCQQSSLISAVLLCQQSSELSSSLSSALLCQQSSLVSAVLLCQQSSELSSLVFPVLRTVVTGVFCTALLKEADIECGIKIVCCINTGLLETNLVHYLMVSRDTALYWALQLINSLVSEPLKGLVCFTQWCKDLTRRKDLSAGNAPNIISLWLWTSVEVFDKLPNWNLTSLTKSYCIDPSFRWLDLSGLQPINATEHISESTVTGKGVWPEITSSKTPLQH